MVFVFISLSLIPLVLVTLSTTMTGMYFFGIKENPSFTRNLAGGQLWKTLSRASIHI